MMPPEKQAFLRARPPRVVRLRWHGGSIRCPREVFPIGPRTPRRAPGTATRYQLCLKARRAAAGRKRPVCFVLAPQRLFRLSRFVATPRIRGISDPPQPRRVFRQSLGRTVFASDSKAVSRRFTCSRTISNCSSRRSSFDPQALIHEGNGGARGEETGQPDDGRAWPDPAITPVVASFFCVRQCSSWTVFRSRTSPSMSRRVC